MKRTIILLALLSTVCAVEARHKDCDDDCKRRKQGVRANRFEREDERQAAFKRREGGACLRTILQRKYCITCEANGDGKRVPDYAAKYSKGLQHKKTGILSYGGKKSYEKMVKGLSNGKQKTYNRINLAHGSVRKLVSPQGSATFSFLGTDSSLTGMKSFPRLSSKKAAAQLLEVYLLAIARDVRYEDYGTGQGTDRDYDGTSITEKASRVLTDFGKCYKGPVNEQGIVDPQVLFRGNNDGALVGPYISQFLYQPLSIPVGAFPPEVGVANLPLDVFQIDQVRPIAGPRNFGITMKDFVAIQNGQVPQAYEFTDYDATAKRYIINGRDLASLVHFDYPYEAYYNTLRTLALFGFPFAPNSPYSDGSIKNEEAFVDFGAIDVFGLIAQVTEEAAKAAWAHKWRAQRVLRPEALAGLVQLKKKTGENTYGLNDSIFECHGGVNVLKWVKRVNKEQGACTYLLPLVYPEGSPQHPSYPAGHATIAGACITIIKAIFDDTILIKSKVAPVKPNPQDPTQLIELSGEGENQMTLGSELNKLAANISIGRNFAGVHYRADGDLGMLLGEQVAIKVLQDHASCFTEQTFNGFELTKIDGTRIRITREHVKEIS